MATSNDDTPDGNDGHPPKDLYYVHDENSITFINKDGDILARGTGDTAGYGSWSNKSVFEAYIRRDNKGKYSYIPLYPDIVTAKANCDDEGIISCIMVRSCKQEWEPDGASKTLPMWENRDPLYDLRLFSLKAAVSELGVDPTVCEGLNARMWFGIGRIAKSNIVLSQKKEDYNN